MMCLTTEHLKTALSLLGLESHGSRHELLWRLQNHLDIFQPKPLSPPPSPAKPLPKPRALAFRTWTTECLKTDIENGIVVGYWRDSEQGSEISSSTEESEDRMSSIGPDPVVEPFLESSLKWDVECVEERKGRELTMGEYNRMRRKAGFKRLD